MRFLLAAAVLLLVACAAEPAPSGSGDVQSYCGRYAYETSQGTCICATGYDWCYPEDVDDTNCCPIPAYCGNGICDPGESAASCSGDCPAGVTCGDGRCDASEARTTCPADCGAPSVCGNGDCEFDENARSCPADCDTSSEPICGDRVCESGETATSCPADCNTNTAPVCGNRVCEAGETATSCPADCDTSSDPVCGDRVCEAGETAAGCPADCGEPECATAPCVEERCFDMCGHSRECGATDDEVAECNTDCFGWDEYYDEWLDPRVKRADCYAALGSLFACVAVASCEDLDSGDPCVREFARYERECREIPYTVDVTLLAALMGPHSPDGCQWDGPTCDPVSSETLRQLGTMISTAAGRAFGAAGVFVPAELQEALADIAASVLGGLLSSTAPPDIFGTVTVVDSLSGARSAEVGVTDNSYRASLGPSFFPDVALDNRVRVNLDLYDEDLTVDDPVGPVNLDRHQLLTAWMTGGNAWVLVADRPGDPVLQVQLRVDAVDWE